MIPIGTEITAATAVITRVPTSACAAPPPPIAPRAEVVRKSRSSPATPRLVTSKISERSGISARPKAETISRVMVRSSARRLPSTERAQAYITISETRTVKTRVRAIVKSSKASRTAAESRAEPPMTA